MLNDLQMMLLRSLSNVFLIKKNNIYAFLFDIYLFIVYSLIMSKRRIEIMSHLESAAVDGAFKLHVDRNGQLIATDLLEKTKPFAIRFDGAENPLDRFVDLYVNSEDLIAQD